MAMDGETMETVTDFIFLDSKINVDSDCSHKIKRHLLLGRRAMTNLDSVLKSRDITLLTKVCIVKAMVFPVVTYGCESWTIKKAECQRIDAGADRGAWWAAIHGVAKSRVRLSDFTFTFHFHASGKKMATHSSILAWRIPRTGEPGGLLSMGSHRVGHD